MAPLTLRNCTLQSMHSVPFQSLEIHHSGGVLCIRSSLKTKPGNLEELDDLGENSEEANFRSISAEGEHRHGRRFGG